MTGSPLPPRGSSNGRRAWQTLLGLAISILLLWWALRGVRPAEVAHHLGNARPGPIAIAVLLATLTFPLRAGRWRLLLRADDGGHLPAMALWHATAMGFMANNILPLRVGEVVRTYAASQLGRVRFSTALASLAVERLFDAVTVISLLAIGLRTSGLPSSANIAGFHIEKVVAVLGLGAIAGLLICGLVVAFPLPAEALVKRLLRSPRASERVVHLFQGIRHGFSALRSPVRIAGAIAWSLAIWLTTALSFYTMYDAFDIPVRFPGALLMQGLIMVGIAAPSTPGYLGVFEAPVVAALGLYDVAPSLAVSYAFTYHFTTFIPITLLGLLSVARTGLILRQFQRPAP